MAKWTGIEFFDGGATAFKANVTKMYLLKAYAANDSWATVSGNKICEVSVVSGDFVLSGASGADRVMTGPSGKSAAASAGSGAGPDLHIAFVDSTNSKVYWVTDETTDQVVTSGNTVNFPQLTYTFKQPT